MPIRRSPPRTVALLVLALVASAAGYFAFPRDSPPEPPGQPQADPEELAARPFDAGLAGVLRRLDTIRLHQREQMARATSVGGQAQAGRAIASAYRKAAASTDELTPADAQRRAAEVLIDELRRTARAYDELARAARGRHRRRYNDHRRAIGRREAAVRRAVRALGLR